MDSGQMKVQRYIRRGAHRGSRSTPGERVPPTHRGSDVSRSSVRMTWPARYTWI